VVVAAMASILITGCSTEVDLSADYKPTTIVYGLLDPGQDTQWVKINKTFVGDGNNFDYALIRDSSEYDFSTFTAIVEELEADGDVVNTYSLDSLTIHDKEISGVFYAPHQTVYYFTSPGGLNQDHDFKLSIDFDEKNDVDATTELVRLDEIVMENPMQNSGGNLQLAQSVGEFDFQYKTHTIRFIPIDNAPFYEITLRFYYNELVWADEGHTTLVSETFRSIDYFVGSFDEDNVNSSGKILADIGGEAFFAFLGNNLEASPFITREIGWYDPAAIPEAATRAFDVIINAGGEDLYTFFQVNSPVTGIIQERPSYTNVNGALGLFSSRATHQVSGVFLTNVIGVPNEGVERAFVNGEYTLDLNFCNPNPTSDLSCD
ncbi:MAG: DUF4249 family protein, partial [Flavobacteriales bacterium]|nr:DUF4249 family protein [Flavobacteriales bacterium]